jgi:hypothetical protein
MAGFPSVVLTLQKISDNVTEIENHSPSGVERSTLHGLLSFAVAAIFISPPRRAKVTATDNSCDGGPFRSIKVEAPLRQRLVCRQLITNLA